MQSLLRNRSSLHICAASCPTAQKHANPIPAPILRQSTPARIDLGALAWREGRIPWRNRLRERLPGKALHGYLFYALTGYATGPLASRRTPLGSVHHHRHYGQKGQTDRTESGSSTVRDYFRSLPFGLGRLNRKGHRVKVGSFSEEVGVSPFSFQTPSLQGLSARGGRPALPFYRAATIPRLTS
jgi:hypothetical protein